jgi:hypothetical protein
MPGLDPASLAPLIAYALWAVLLVIVLGVARGGAMRGGKRAVNTFKPIGDTETLDAFSRAHMNTLENLPIFAAVYLSALLIDPNAPFVTLGWVILGARIVQSLVHISSRSPNAVRFRALMLLVQSLGFLWIGGNALVWALS